MITAILSYFVGEFVEKRFGRFIAFIIGFGGFFFALFLMTIKLQNLDINLALAIWTEYFRGFLAGDFISILLTDSVAYVIGSIRGALQTS